jgi:hypothetical protein
MRHRLDAIHVHVQLLADARPQVAGRAGGVAAECSELVEQFLDVLQLRFRDDYLTLIRRNGQAAKSILRAFQAIARGIRIDVKKGTVEAQPPD